MSDRWHDELAEEYEFLRLVAAGNPACQITDYDAYVKACARHGLKPLEDK